MVIKRTTATNSLLKIQWMITIVSCNFPSQSSYADDFVVVVFVVYTDSFWILKQNEE